ncbi:unnamed protein product [Clonostachys byssicola]|uniref:Uncharacterized protein n=1 Tax=Clonostachys byssicola TaxID=160290 RepID=A0A9N9UHS1_9HYPO|nr:unnamed protein product [Clonostachys byssicola]
MTISSRHRASALTCHNPDSRKHVLFKLVSTTTSARLLVFIPKRGNLFGVAASGAKDSDGLGWQSFSAARRFGGNGNLETIVLQPRLPAQHHHAIPKHQVAGSAQNPPDHARASRDRDQDMSVWVRSKKIIIKHDSCLPATVSQTSRM